VHQIINVHHMLGKINVVADGLSRQWEGQPAGREDRGDWTVNPDRDEQTGLINNVLLTLEGTT
jgi:hypothetical protein